MCSYFLGDSLHSALFITFFRVILNIRSTLFIKKIPYKAFKIAFVDRDYKSENKKCDKINYKEKRFLQSATKG